MQKPLLLYNKINALRLEVDGSIVDDIKSAVDDLVEHEKNSLMLAVEFGYKQCEKGNNMQHALMEFEKLSNETNLI